MNSTSKKVSYSAIFGGLFALVFIALAVFAPVLSPSEDNDAFKQVGRRSDFQPHPPSPEAPLGTLPQQIDVYHSLIWGARDALVFSLSVVTISAIFGGLLGAISGMSGGWLNRIILRVTDTFLTIPLIVGVVFLQQLINTSVEALSGYMTYQLFIRGGDPLTETNALINFFEVVDPILVSFLALSWMGYTRMMNASVITVKQEEYIEAARSVGVSQFRLLFRHILPNAFQPLLVMAARDVGNVLILQATLTFLKVGGNSIWGEMLALGRDWIIGPNGSLFDTWWVYLPATLIVILFSITWNLLGEGLNQSLLNHR
ncbi:MAG TPA: ABC transporter permease [Anaerolineales bacterium]|nr:ABC transporter permease [Anaerolineales bacterium]